MRIDRREHNSTLYGKKGYEYTQEYKYLGVWIDDQLKGSKYIQSLKEKEQKMKPVMWKLQKTKD